MNKILFLTAFTFFFISIFISCQNSSDKIQYKTQAKIVSDTSPINQQTKNDTVVQKPASLVNDYENILDINTVDSLLFLVYNLRDKTAIELAVVTTPTFAPYNSIEEFSENLGNKWGMGLKEVNEGIIVVVSATQRKVRIFTGLGMDQFLSDDEGLKIVNEQMLPFFKQGNYPKGIVTGIKELIRVLTLKSFPDSH